MLDIFIRDSCHVKDGKGVNPLNFVRNSTHISKSNLISFEILMKWKDCLPLAKAAYTRRQNALPEGNALTTNASDPANDCNFLTVTFLQLKASLIFSKSSVTIFIRDYDKLKLKILSHEGMKTMSYMSKVF